MQREYVMGEVPSDVAIPKPAPRALGVPPLKTPPLEHVTERYSMEDAERQAAMIREAWRRAGHTVDAYAECYKVGGQPCYRVVLPDMVNGLPASVFMAKRGR